MMRYSSPSILTSLPEYLPNRIRSPALTSSGIFLPSSVTLPVPDRDDLALLGLLLGGVGDDDAAVLLVLLLERLTRMRSWSGRSVVFVAVSHGWGPPWY